jgi:hypothetical protein
VGGALEAAGSLGKTAVKSICEVLVATVEGIKDVACAALPKPRAEAGAPAEEKAAPAAPGEKKGTKA